MYKFSEKNHPPIAFTIFLFFLLAIGIFLRLFEATNYLPYNTVISYYFYKTDELVESGKFPKTDRWNFAPETLPEDAPPGLAYTTWLLYAPFSALKMSLFQFAHVFPILIYIIWFFVLYFVFRDLFSRGTALVSVILFSILPVAVSLTTWGHYLQETLGNLLLFISIYAFLRIITSPRRWVFYGATAVLGLILTWQQFLIFYIAALAALVPLSLLDWKKIKTRGAWLAAFFLFPILCAELLGRYVWQIEYTPLLFLGESLYGFLHYNSPDLLLAMRRTDWSNATISNFYQYFGAGGFILGIFGAISALADFKNPRKIAILSLAVIGLLPVLAFVKDRYLTMTFLLFLFAVGIEEIISFYRGDFHLLTRIKSFWSLLHEKLLAARSLCGNKFLICLILLLLFLDGLYAIFLQAKEPGPLPVVSFQTTKQSTNIYKVKVSLKNAGGHPSKDDKAFAGLHIEVENAKVRTIRPQSNFTTADLAIKNFANIGSIFFFETKYKNLGPEETGSVNFIIEPYSTPVNLYIRAWIPSNCSYEQKKTVLNDLLPTWQSFKNGWRNEECIQRFPEDREQEFGFCKAPVFAAHQSLQDFRCLKIPLRPQ